MINKTLRVPRLIIRDTPVHPSLDMAGGLDIFIEEASASLRYQSLKEEQKRAVEAFVEEIAVRIFVRARRVYLIAVQSLHTAGTTLHMRCHQTLPPLERVWSARLVPVNVTEGHLREQYEMGEVLPEDDEYRNSGNPLYEATPWPTDEDKGTQFRELMMTHYHAMTNAGMEFLRLTAIGFGLDEHIPLIGVSY